MAVAGSSADVLGGTTSLWQYCHTADPEACWAVTGRRNFLAAAGAASSKFVACAWLKLIQQCDHKILVGGAGVQVCGKCTHRELRFVQMPTKSPLPATFKHGQAISLSCWQERFAAVSKNGAAGDQSLVCVAGKWYNSLGTLGLSDFACGACIQVANSSYLLWDRQKRQELYFFQHMKNKFWVKGHKSYGLRNINTQGTPFGAGILMLLTGSEAHSSK